MLQVKESLNLHFTTVSGPINCHVLAISGSINWQLVSFYGARNSHENSCLHLLVETETLHIIQVSNLRLRLSITVNYFFNLVVLIPMVENENET